MKLKAVKSGGVHPELVEQDANMAMVTADLDRFYDALACSCEGMCECDYELTAFFISDVFVVSLRDAA